MKRPKAEVTRPPAIALLISLAALPLHEASAEPATAAAQAVNLEAFIASMQKTYDRTRVLEADFSQTYKPKIGPATNSQGTAVFKRPGKMRWQYNSPAKKEFISNGHVLWLVDAAERHVFLNENFTSAMMPESISFLWGEGNLKKSFDIELSQTPLATGGEVTLVLKPKQASGYARKIVFAVNAKTYRVTEALIFDSMGNQNHMRFANIAINREVPDSRFDFQIPKGYNVMKAPKP